MWRAMNEGQETELLEFEELLRVLKSTPSPGDVLVRHGEADRWIRAKDIPEIRNALAAPEPRVDAADITARTEQTREEGATASGLGKIVQALPAIVAGVVSYQLAQRLGINFWLPLISTVLAWLICRKLFADHQLVIAGTAALAHAIWFSVIIVVALLIDQRTGEIPGLLAEVVALVALVVWMRQMPTSFGVYGLLAVEALALSTNIIAATQSPDGFVIYVHIALRGAAIFGCAWAIWRRWRDDAIPQTP